MPNNISHRQNPNDLNKIWIHRKENVDHFKFQFYWSNASWADDVYSVRICMLRKFKVMVQNANVKLK